MCLNLKGFLKCRPLLLLVIFSLISCSAHLVHPKHPTAIQQIQSTVQESIQTNKKLYPQSKLSSSNLDAALFPPLSRYVNSTKETQDRFDVAANQVPAREFYMGLVAGTPYNMVINPNVSGTISLTLKNVTIKQAMDAVRDIYGYEYHRTSYGYEVLAPQLETQLFHINYLDVQRIGRSYTQVTTGQISNKIGTSSTSSTAIATPTAEQEGIGTISTIETKSEMQFWKNIEKSIQNILGKEEGRSVTVNSQAGVIIVRAYPGELNRVARYVNSLQASLNRQVILEAKILEVELKDSFQAGVDWSILANPAADALNQTGSQLAGIGQAGSSAFSDTDLKELNGIFAIRVKGNFKTLINLLQIQGNVQVLSSPHISTVNNQKAVIKVGQDEFFVTGVSTSNTIIGTNTIPSQDVSLTPFFSGITLDVTPEISGDGTIILHIHPSVSKVTEQTKTIVLGSTSSGSANNLKLPLAFSTIRESDNIVKAKNGQVVVIGGLMQNNTSETIVATPGLGNIPFFGALFRRTAQKSVKSELVILLRPIVTNNQAFIDTLQDEKKSFKILKRPFHRGGLPKIFGNEGELENDG